jgi:hypothetical protein
VATPRRFVSDEASGRLLEEREAGMSDSDHFDVKSYSVTINHGNPKTSERVLLLDSGDLSHGIRALAYLNFVESPKALGTIELHELTYIGPRISCYFQAGEFEEIYDLLRSERPVTFGYAWATEGPGGTGDTRNLVGVQLKTGAEPLGEGPVDPS